VQLAWHLAWQSAEGGVPVQPALQSPSQVALHEPSQLALQFESELVEHLASQSPEQFALQEALQFAEQSKLPGLTLHFASQLETSQLPVHAALAVPVHIPLQLA
jgi:hypothetical protein